MPPALDERRRYSAGRFAELKASLAVAQTIANGKACVYVIGSFGRGEASPHSDLDLFIVARHRGLDDAKSSGG